MTRSAVRSRLAPPRFALRATRGAAARSLRGEAWCPAKPKGRRRALAKFAPVKLPAPNVAGGNVVRLYYPQRSLSGSGIHRRQRRPEATPCGSQRRPISAHRKIQAVEAGLVLRL